MLELSAFRRDLQRRLIYTRPMSLPPAVSACVSRAVALFACTALLVGCTTSPTSGRAQFNILPGALETTVPDLRFDVKTLLAAGREFCKEEESPCPAQEAAEKLAQRIAPIAERLGTLTAELSPELVTRVPHVEVFVVPNDAPSVSSSAGGKIAVSAGLARLDLSDAELALALAREFGRLAAAHHRESTSAGLAVSLVAGSPLTSAYLATSILADIIFPMGALAKIGISLIASMGTEQLVEASQQTEADEFAGKLLLAAGYDLRELATARPDAPDSAVKIGWLPNYFASRTRVASMAPPPELAAKAPPDQESPTEALTEGGTPAAGAVAAAPAPEEPSIQAEVAVASAPAAMPAQSAVAPSESVPPPPAPTGPPPSAATPQPEGDLPKAEAVLVADLAPLERQPDDAPDLQEDPPTAKPKAAKKKASGVKTKKNKKAVRPVKKVERR